MTIKEVLQQNIDQLAQISRERAKTGVSESDDPALREIRHQMRELATEAFYTQIKTFRLNQLVMMLDTCEWLIEPEGIEVGQWVLNELVPGLHTRIQQQGRQCHVVMVSRVKLKLDVINGREQKHLTLPMLGKAEVDQYLEHIGMQDAELRQRVFDVTHGHALCVSIIGDYWQQREEQNEPFTIADLPELQLKEYSEKALMQFTNERVLKHLKSPYRELTCYGVLLRSFDLPLLRNVFPELLPEAEALERFNQLIRYPYIEARGTYRYAFHELLREALSEVTQKEGPDEWKCYHKRALDYLTQLSSPTPDWYYHLLAYDEKQGLVEWQLAIQEAREGGKREFIGALLQAALDDALHLSPAVHAEVSYEQGRFNYYGVQWEEALQSYNEALTVFQQLEDYAGQAKVLQAIGDVQRTLGKQDAALLSYEQALAFFRQLGDKSGEAISYQAMGDVQRLRKDLDTALHCYEECFNLFQQLQNRSEEAKALEAIGDVQLLRNDQGAALSSYEQAFALYQEEKDQLKRAKVLKSIADVQRFRQETNAALESYAQALALFGELKEPAEESNVRHAMEEMQQPQSDQETMRQSNGQIQQADQFTNIPPTPQTPPSYAVSLAVQQRRRGLLAGIAALVIVLIMLSSGLIINNNVLQPYQLQARATATIQAHATATLNARMHATATLIAKNPNPYPPYRGTLALYDLLSGNGNGYNWDEYVGSGYGCVFEEGTYHVIAQLGFYFSCTANNTNFHNFTFEVQMTILKGDCGGIIFRADTRNNKLYFFQICTRGDYELYSYAGANTANAKTLRTGFSSAIATGLNQHNVIAVIANGSSFNLYVNDQWLNSITDSTYSNGQISLAASSYKSPTEVVFRNAKIWTL